MINYVHGREAKVAEEEAAMNGREKSRASFFTEKNVIFGSHGTIQPLIPQAEEWRTL